MLSLPGRLSFDVTVTFDDIFASACIFLSQKSNMPLWHQRNVRDRNGKMSIKDREEEGTPWGGRRARNPSQRIGHNGLGCGLRLWPPRLGNVPNPIHNGVGLEMYS